MKPDFFTFTPKKRMTEESPTIWINTDYTSKEVFQAYHQHYRSLINLPKNLIMGVITFVMAYLINKYMGMGFPAFTFYAFSIIFFGLHLFTNVGIPFFRGYVKNPGHLEVIMRSEYYQIGNNQYEWKDLEDIIETDKAFRLYRATNDFLLLPKRAFQDYNQLATFRTFFSKYLVTYK